MVSYGFDIIYGLVELTSIDSSRWIYGNSLSDYEHGFGDSDGKLLD
jgi:hypothetical protein